MALSDDDADERKRGGRIQEIKSKRELRMEKMGKKEKVTDK